MKGMMNTKATQYLRGGKTTDIVIVASAPAVTGPASAATGTRGRVVGPGGGRGVMNRGRGAEQRDIVGRRGFQAVAGADGDSLCPDGC